MNILRKKEGQGTTEYIVILAIVVFIAVAVVKTNLTKKLNDGVNSIGDSITTATQQK